MKHTNRTRKLCGLPCTVEALGDVIAALHSARSYTSSYDGAEKIEGAEELCERYGVAIRSLGRRLLETVESLYEPTKYRVGATIEKEFEIDADDAVDAVRRVADAVKANGGSLVDADAKEADDE